MELNSVEGVKQPKSKNVKGVKTPKTPEQKISFKFKRWFFGIGKEFSRISWTPKKKIIANFFIILIIVFFLSLVFLGIDKIFIN